LKKLIRPLSFVHRLGSIPHASSTREYHLRRPGRGQERIRVGNDYLLVSILPGVIAGVIAAN
jgi:Ni/Co efflux regulator RcnB